MTASVFTTALLIGMLQAVPAAGIAQPVPGASGHWEGAIQVPGQELKIELDLAPAGDKWEGTITIPAQGLKGFPLAGVTVQGETVTFAMDYVPGNPQFAGTVSKDGKTLSGELKQGGGTVPFSVTRTGEAKIERLPASTPVIKEMEGTWEGALDVNGKALRLVLTLANQPGAAATGTLVSVDQGGAEVPIAVVIQSGTHLKVMIPTIVGTYEGDLKEGQLIGTWTQGPRSFPLVFKRKP